ncbi:MAG: M55 family metallopeptidase [Clostridiaceae bacterium]
MKIFIMTDMEGVCGVLNHDDWVMQTGRYYEEGKKLLTLEVNAAAEGFFRAGADEVMVLDGHGAGGINQLLLDNRTSYIRSSVGPYPFSLDKSYDAIAWVGQHAKAGTEFAHIAHTGWFNVLDFKINDVSVGEFGQMAMMASFLGIRSIFGSGDEAFTHEAKTLVGGIETVSVKKGLTPGKGDETNCDGYRNRNLSAIHIHPEKARELIINGAEMALDRFIHNRSRFELIDVRPPYKKEIRYRQDGNTPAYEAYNEHPVNLIELMNSPERIII